MMTNRRMESAEEQIIKLMDDVGLLRRRIEELEAQVKEHETRRERSAYQLNRALNKLESRIDKLTATEPGASMADGVIEDTSWDVF